MYKDHEVWKIVIQPIEDTLENKVYFCRDAQRGTGRIEVLNFDYMGGVTIQKVDPLCEDIKPTMVLGNKDFQLIADSFVQYINNQKKK
jgi:hypothetical protein